MHAIEATISRFSEGTNNAFALRKLEPPMSQLGQKRRGSRRANVVRSASESGHQARRLDVRPVQERTFVFKQDRNLARLNCASGGNFVLYCTNDRREDGATRAACDHLGDDAADAQIARLRCSRDRRHQ
jgi:hypothetical protein